MRPTIPSPRAAPALLCCLLSVAMSFARPAYACGGCFSPATATRGADNAVLQSAERVLFVRDPVTKTSLAWIEVRYSGLAKNFAWVIPLPKVPKVGVGTSYAFNRLDLATAPRFRRTFTGKLENCRMKPTPGGSDAGSSAETMSEDPGGGGGCGGDPGGFSNAYGSSFSNAGSGSGRGVGLTHSDGGARSDPDSAVKIVEQDQVGPYDWVVLDAKAPDAVAQWLKNNGYGVPASAKSIIAAHVAKGDVFLAVKLSAGVAVSEIRPITLEMADTEPCVPLRLTSIAATSDLSVVAYLSGNGRAIPKNHLHVVVNPMRINLIGGGQNYAQVLSVALDEASGRAFATEYAGPMSAVSIPAEYKFERALRRDAVHDAGPPLQPARLATAGFVPVKNAEQLFSKLITTDYPITRDTVAIFDQFAGVMALAQAANTMSQPLDPVWVYARLRSSLAVAGVESLSALPVDGAKLAAALEKGFTAPLVRLDSFLAKNPTLTRLAMLISPQEMTRDPIFAFNPDLPSVESIREVRMTGVCSTGWYPPDTTRVEVNDAVVGGSWLFPGAPKDFINSALDSRFSSAPAAFRIEVLEESGESRPVASAQVDLVDAAIAGAVPGGPTLATGFVLAPAGDNWKPPADDPTVTKVESLFSGSGMAHGGALAWFAALVSAMVVLRLRRKTVR